MFNLLQNEPPVRNIDQDEPSCDIDQRKCELHCKDCISGSLYALENLEMYKRKPVTRKLYSKRYVIQGKATKVEECCKLTILPCSLVTV
ncbi:unnamed protein product [Camellia sinensis]